MKKYFLIMVALAVLFVQPMYAEITLPKRVNDGAILHCWNWSFNNIKANLDKIAEQGFTAIQTSPLQPAKQTVKGATVYDWWVLYQPIEFKIADGGNNAALGTKQEFAEMCAAAEERGIKVIVDVVANHLANERENVLSNAIPEYLRTNDNYWHWSAGHVMNTSGYSNRSDITWNTMSGLPDLNTENADIQNFVLNYLKECIDCGADGFRFDAAKHINCPADVRYQNNAENNFWPTVVNGAHAYANAKGKSLFIYGEILDNATANQDRAREHDILNSYQQYMSITASVSSKNVLEAVHHNNPAGASNSYIGLTDAPLNKAVIWCESHDTYANTNGETRNISADVINRTWGMVGSRSPAPALYFARPNALDGTQFLGEASMSAWTNAEVKAVNRLKNATVGEGEYLSNHDAMKLAMNERGTKGAVIVATGTNRTVAELTAYRLADGAYTDLVSGSVFNVVNHKISGTIGQSGVAVLLNENPAATTSTNTIRFNNETYNWNGVHAYVYVDGGASNAPWPGLPMTRNTVTGLYEYAVPAALANGRVIFTENASTTNHRYPADGQQGLLIEAKDKYFAANHSWSEKTTDTAYEGVQVFFNHQGNSTWSAPHIHYFGGTSNTNWPGMAMSFDAVTGYYFYNMPAEYHDKQFIVNNNNQGQQCDTHTLAGKTVLVKYKSSMADYVAPFYVPTTAKATTVRYLAEGWNEVYAYVWDNHNRKPFGEWPGKAMTKDDANHYSIVIPAGFETANIIFHHPDNTTLKTNNIPLLGKDQGYTGMDGRRFHSVNVGDTKFATFYIDYPSNAPAGVILYAGKIETDRIKLTPIEGTLPKNTGVVLEATAPGVVDFIENKTENPAVIEGNELKGSIVEISQEAGMNYYMLRRKDGKAIFALLADGVKIPPHRAYLDFSTGQPTQAFSLDFGNISSVEKINLSHPASTEGIFDLSGRRVLRPQSGSIYIKAGKKFVQP